MLRGNGHLSDPNCSVASLEVVPLAVQGILSQTFRFKVTYTNEPNPGTPSVFVAKFVNPDPSFAPLRLLFGSSGLDFFESEFWAYDTSFYEKQGVRQPKCYFSSYDPVRETFCFLLEDLDAAGLQGGDQLSGGPGKGLPPDMDMFLSLTETNAKLCGKFYNNVLCKWEGAPLLGHELGGSFKNPFCSTMFPAINGKLILTSPEIMERAGLMPTSDPFWACLTEFVENEAALYASPPWILTFARIFSQNCRSKCHSDCSQTQKSQMRTDSERSTASSPTCACLRQIPLPC